ncbi:MAG: phosphopantetheine-binding protein, partial [Balneolaceae bacterium]
LYKDNIKRSGFQNDSSSLKEFIEGLNLDIRIKEATPEEISRVSQLTYRTNQFNFTTIRRSEKEIEEVLGRDGFVCKVCRVKDRFGDYGLVGAMLYKILPGRILLDSFMLSCRVLGRGVEHSMLRSVGETARAHGLGTVQVNFGETEKNLPARNFLQAVSRDYSGSIPLTDEGYVMPSDYLSGLIYDPDNQKSGESRANGQVKKSVSNASREHQGQIFEQIAKELHQPSKIDELLREKKDSNVKKPPASSSAERDPLQKITEIWESTLDRENIGPDEHFFAVGGTSLKAVEVLSQLNEQFNKNLTIVSLFEHSTIRLLAELVESRVENNSEFDRIIKRAGSRRNRIQAKKIKKGHDRRKTL